MNDKPSMLRASILSLFPGFRVLVFFSIITNVLMLSSTVYMLQVYDRVVNSRSEVTLLMLTIAVFLAYFVLEFIEWVRAELLKKISTRWDLSGIQDLLRDVYLAKLNRDEPAERILTDWKTLRDFLASPTALAILDTPMAALILIVLFMIHPLMGAFAVFLAIIQIYFALRGAYQVKSILEESSAAAWQAHRISQQVMKHAEAIKSMGMLNRMRQRWKDVRQNSIELQSSASRISGRTMAIAKFLQLVQGSALLGIGVWLSITGHPISGGVMIASSVLGARAIGPFVQVVGQIRQIESARSAYKRLDLFMQARQAEQQRMSLPPPRGAITLEVVTITPPGASAPTLRDVTCDIQAGTVVAVVGPSASGKSTLAKAICGVWAARTGKVRLDGNDIQAWSMNDLGPYMGYLPQEHELFDGTIAENIARFGEIDQEKIDRAAKLVDLQDIISDLPNGFDTVITTGGSELSGGTRQRVALARAVYGEPKILVLDEPDSSLDVEGENALMNMLSRLKMIGTTVILITHRFKMMKYVDTIAVIVGGGLKMYGPRNEILEKLKPSSSQPAALSLPSSVAGGIAQ